MIECDCDCHVDQTKEEASNSCCHSCGHLHDPPWPTKTEIQVLLEKIIKLEAHVEKESTTLKYVNMNLRDACGRIEKLEERMGKLEVHKNYQVEENRKSSRRLDEFQDNFWKFCGQLQVISNTLTNIIECLQNLGLKKE